MLYAFLSLCVNALIRDFEKIETKTFKSTLTYNIDVTRLYEYIKNDSNMDKFIGKTTPTAKKNFKNPYLKNDTTI